MITTLVSYGDFAGKYTFASTEQSPTVYLKAAKFKGPKGDILLPAMISDSVTREELCLFYTTNVDNGEYYMQLGSLLWVTFDSTTQLNWLFLTPDFTKAIPIKLGGSPSGQELYAIVNGRPQKIYYETTDPAILTLNESSSASSRFAPSIVTSSLAALRVNGGDNADLSNVNLSGTDLSNITFKKANFSGSTLNGAICNGADFTEALFVESTLTGITANKTIFDRANFTKAILDKVAWGIPTSAKGANFTNCSAVDAILGSATQTLDCSGATLTQGDFRGADLSKWNLSKAIMGDVLMVGTKLNGVVFDGANMVNAIMVRASLVNASMKNVIAHGTNLIGANLSHANLNQAQMGSRAFLFFLFGKFKTKLDEYTYPQNDLISAFSDNGVTLSSQAPIIVLVSGERWDINDFKNGPFALNIDEHAQISVSRKSANLTPATLAGATCLGTQASSAMLTGADLRGVQWHAEPATLDHADLEGARLNESLFVQTNFTQAFLSGADFSSSILVGASFKGCKIAANTTHQPTSFAHAQLQGADFTQATILSAAFYQAGIATADGVPLFDLPLSDESKLNSGEVSELTSTFDQAGYPLGQNPTISKQQKWNINNSQDPDRSSPRKYVVAPRPDQLAVYDGANNDFLFNLPQSYVRFLKDGTASQSLISAFIQAGYTLATDAPISNVGGWEVQAGDNQPFLETTNYPSFYIQALTGVLQVYGTPLIRLRDWDAYPNGVAFNGTKAFQEALSLSTIGPSGYPYSMKDSSKIDWIEYLRLLSNTGISRTYGDKGVA